MQLVVCTGLHESAAARRVFITGRARPAVTGCRGSSIMAAVAVIGGVSEQKIQDLHQV